MTLEDAIRMIQIHERARQGRLRAKICQEIRQQEERERLAANRGAPTLDPDIAATRIQKVRCHYSGGSGAEWGGWGGGSDPGSAQIHV